MIDVILVGFGWWGQHMARRLVGHAALHPVCVVEPDTGNHAAIRALGLEPVADYARALADFPSQAVILTSPNDQHDTQVAMAAARGLHVFCEKPLSLTPEGARASVAACRASGVVLGIGHERRFEPAIGALKAILDHGALGTVMHAELAFSHNKLARLPPTSWRTTKRHAPAAGMTQMGIHLTDIMIWFFGPVAEVAAFAADRSLGWETGDLITVQLRFETGMTATMQAILNTPHFIRTHVFGTTGWVEIRNPTHPDTPGGQAEMQIYRSLDDITRTNFDWTDSVLANLDAFAAAIDGHAPYPYSEVELIHNIEVLDAIIRSAETGQVTRPMRS